MAETWGLQRIAAPRSRLLQNSPLHGQFGRDATADLCGDVIADGVLLMAREIEGLDKACGFVVRIDGLNGDADGRGAAVELQPWSASPRAPATTPAPIGLRTKFFMLVSNPSPPVVATTGDARLESA